MSINNINQLLANSNPYTGNNNPISLGSNTVTTPASQSNNYYVSERAFILGVRGLRPLTTHSFYFGNTDVSSNCAVIPNSGGSNSSPQTFNPNTALVSGIITLGSPLTSDQYGTLQFVFFFNSGLIANTNYFASQMIGNLSGGAVICSVKSSDGSSTATVSINILKGSNTSANFKLPVTKDATGNTLLSVPSSAFNY